MDYAERLNNVNQGMRFTDIHGKQYAEVNQRVLGFWSLFPNGRIVTRKVADDGKRCDFECLVYRDAADAEPTVTGHAFEVRQGSINTTSYVENCETGAIGRALGLLGIGATTAIASADEVLSAIEHQEQQGFDDRQEHMRRRLWESIKRWSELNGRDPNEVGAEVKQRRDYEESADWFETVAMEFEQ